MSKISLWWHFLRHTRPHQLWARLRLTIKRKILVRLSPHIPTLAIGLASESFPLAEPLPTPLFPARHHLVEQSENKRYVCFLNEKRELRFPMEWHPPELETGTRLWKLNLHYMEFLEGLDDQTFMDVVYDWIQNNPPYRPGYWLDNWNSYALSIRCVVWMQQYAKRQTQLTESITNNLLKSLVCQLRFLVRNLELDLGGNHLIKNIKALLWAGRFFSHEEAKQWTQIGIDLLTQAMAEQVLADGLHYELSPGYHAQVFADLLECYQVMIPGTVRTSLATVLDKMAQALVDTTHPDGLVSLFNDGGLHMTYTPQVCLNIYTDLIGKKIAHRKVFALASAGYYGVRSQDSLLIIDCGAIAPDFLPAHGHGDILAFEWTLHGCRFIVDAGVYEYNPGFWRQYARSTVAHNTVTVADQDQCEFWHAFRVGRRAKVMVHKYSTQSDGLALTLEGSHDGYQLLSGAPRHRRCFTATAQRIVVEDFVEGGTGQTVRTRLLCHPQCYVEKNNSSFYIRQGDTLAVLQTESQVTLTDAWWCPDFGLRLRTLQIVIEYGNAPCQGGFVLEALSNIG